MASTAGRSFTAPGIPGELTGTIADMTKTRDGRDSSRLTAPSARAAIVIACALSFITWSLVSFPSLDRKGSQTLAVLRTNRPTEDIVRLSMEPGGNSYSRYSMSIALSLVAPGSTLIVPKKPGAGVQGKSDLRMLGFGDIASIQRWGGDGESLLAGIENQAAYVTAAGIAGSRGAAWEIVLDSRSEPRLDQFDDPLELIPAWRAAGDAAVVTGPPRTFVFLSRPVEQDDLERLQPRDYGYVNVLMETSLIDADLIGAAS
jgi:hypothetical protein